MTAKNDDFPEYEEIPDDNIWWRGEPLDYEAGWIQDNYPDGEAVYQPTRIEQILEWFDYRRFVIRQWYNNHLGRCPECHRWFILGGNHDDCIPF